MNNITDTKMNIPDKINNKIINTKVTKKQRKCPKNKPNPPCLNGYSKKEKLYKDGKIKAIGVSNFLEHHLKDLMQDAEIKPMVDQLEFHPWLVQKDLQNFCKENGIQYEAWSPLMQGKAFKNETLKQLGEKYGKSPAHIVLRWDLQNGVITIPKSTSKDHIESNAAIFDFELTEEDMQTINALDKHERIGPDPDNFDF